MEYGQGGMRDEGEGTGPIPIVDQGLIQGFQWF